MTLSVMAMLAGCAVTAAPADVQQLMTYGFVHHADDARFPEAFADGLLPYVDEHHDALAEGLGVDALTTGELGDVGVEAEDAEIVGFVASVELTSDLDDVASALTYEHMDEVYATTLAFTLRSSTDRACFLAHDCESYDLEATRTLDLGLFGHSTQDFAASMRWTTSPDGAPVMTLRTLAPEPAQIDIPGFELRQQYDVQAFYDDEGVTRRVDAVWVDALVVGAGVPGELALQSAVRQMQAGAEDIDAFINRGGVQ